MKKIEDVVPTAVCSQTFGDFELFKKRFTEIKKGTLPVKYHPSPHSIVTVRKMSKWPETYNRLRHLNAVCFECKNKHLFGECKMCMRAVVGECDGLFIEATKEDTRIKREIRQKNRGREYDNFR